MYAPTQFPPLAWMLADIAATDQQICRHLGITARTLQRYRKQEGAPRAVLLALFWETRWGRSVVENQEAYTADVWRQYAQALERQIVRLKKEIQLLEQQMENPAANHPVCRTA